MKIATCVVTHNRLAYSKRCLGSLLNTGADSSLLVVDNASSDGTQEWLLATDLTCILNPQNRYPGAACNQGWDFLAVLSADLLHRSDNDIEYLPGWQAEVEMAFLNNPDLWLLGILNLHEDHGEPEPPTGLDWVDRVGGNVVIRASKFREGLRWAEQPWAVGFMEDGAMSEAAKGHVARLRRTVANNIAFGRYADFPDYYDRTARERGIADAVHSV